MKQERSKEVLEILNGRETDFQSDPQTKEKIGYFTKLDKEKNSHLIEEMEARGFKVIYPAKLKDDAQIYSGTGIMVEGKYFNQTVENHALIMDLNEPKSLEIAGMIANHFFEQKHMFQLADFENNSMGVYEDKDFEEGSNKKYADLLNEIGYETTIDENGMVTAYSDIPYPEVKKSKYEQIYDKAKGKIKGMLSAIKNKLNIKDKEQDKEEVNENEIDER